MEFMLRTRPDTAIKKLDEAVALMVAASADVLRSVAEVDEGKRWEGDGATSITGWLAARFGLARGTAREWVRVAHALRVLPKIAAAHAAGRLSFDQLRPLTRFATPETDPFWARRGPRLAPREPVAGGPPLRAGSPPARRGRLPAPVPHPDPGRGAPGDVARGGRALRGRGGPRGGALPEGRGGRGRGGASGPPGSPDGRRPRRARHRGARR